MPGAEQAEGAAREYPYQDSRDQGRVLHDEAQHTSGTLSIFALKIASPEQKLRDFFAHGPRKASTVAGKANLGTRQPFPGGMASGKLSHTIQLLHFL